MGFYNDQTNNNKANLAIEPSLIQLHENTLLLVQKTISLKQAVAVKNYFRIQKYDESCHVRKLIVDNCYLGDDELAIILSIGIEQTQVVL